MTRLASLLSLAAWNCFGQPPGFEMVTCQTIKLPGGGFAMRLTDNGKSTAQPNGAGPVIKNGVIAAGPLPVANPGLVYLNGMNESGGFTVIQGEFQRTPEVDGCKLIPRDINQQRVIACAAAASAATEPYCMAADFVVKAQRSSGRPE